MGVEQYGLTLDKAKENSYIINLLMVYGQG